MTTCDLQTGVMDGIGDLFWRVAFVFWNYVLLLDRAQCCQDTKCFISRLAGSHCSGSHDSLPHTVPARTLGVVQRSVGATQ